MFDPCVRSAAVVKSWYFVAAAPAVVECWLFVAAATLLSSVGTMYSPLRCFHSPLGGVYAAVKCLTFVPALPLLQVIYFCCLRCRRVDVVCAFPTAIVNKLLREVPATYLR